MEEERKKLEKLYQELNEEDTFKKTHQETNKPPIAKNPSKSNFDLSVFIFRKLKAKAIGGNNNIDFGIRA